MKLEIIKCSTCEKIETYSVQDFSMLDFQEWKEQNEREVTINLACLSDTATNLNSEDPETLELVSDSREVDFYLPTPLIEKVLINSRSRKKIQKKSPSRFPRRS